MASTQVWAEYNGATHTETDTRTDCNFKTVDDSTSTYKTHPITAGNNSMVKYQALKFGGTWNNIKTMTYKVSSNAPATGVSIVGSVQHAYTQPATTASGDSAASTTGAPSTFGTSSTPFSVAGGASVSGGGTIYANAFRLQMQTTSSASPGTVSTVTITAAWVES